MSTLGSEHALQGEVSVAELGALPRSAGVYTFWGDGALPLYIGKSISLRTRVQSHFREPGEAEMMARVRRLAWQRTAGDVGAQLLEARLIKHMQPLYNVKLRRSRVLHAWRLSPQAPTPPQLVDTRGVDFARAVDLYGLYTSHRAAQEHLDSLARSHRLCRVALGLEKALKRGCFGVQVGLCDGVCLGREPAGAHHDRLMAAVAAQQVHWWPFEGPVGVLEQGDGLTQVHVVDRWCYLGTVDQGQHWPQGVNPAFDLDTYRILVRPLLAGELPLLRGADDQPAACSTLGSV